MKTTLANRIQVWEMQFESVATWTQNVEDDIFMRKPSEDKWSISQIIHHIMLSESQILSSMQWRIANNKIHHSIWPGMLKLWFLKVRFEILLPMKAPEYVADPVNTPKSETMQEWSKIRNDWKLYVETLQSDVYKKAVFKHPILGYLNLYLTLQFMTIHLQRHKKQIKNLLKSDETHM